MVALARFSQSGLTALMVAAIQERTEMLQQLLDHAADIDAKDTVRLRPRLLPRLSFIVGSGRGGAGTLVAARSNLCPSR